MKRVLFVAIFFAMLILIVPSLAEATETRPSAIVDVESLVLLDKDLTRDVSHTRVSRTVNLYLPIQVNTLSAGGSDPNISHYHAHVVTVEYVYYVSRNSSGQPVVGYVATGSYPNFTSPSGFVYPLNQSASTLQNPSLNSVVGYNTYYEVTISGGLFQITYNAVINLDVNGNVQSVESQTVNGAFFYQYSGTI